MTGTAKPAAARLDTIPWEKRPHLRLEVAADVTGVSRSTLYKLAAEGRLTLKRLAGRVVVETAGVRKLVETAEPWRPSTRNAPALEAVRGKRSAPARAALR